MEGCPAIPESEIAAKYNPSKAGVDSPDLNLGLIFS
jgi:hypothetical protein